MFFVCWYYRKLLLLFQESMVLNQKAQEYNLSLSYNYKDTLYFPQVFLFDLWCKYDGCLLLKILQNTSNMASEADDVASSAQKGGWWYSHYASKILVVNIMHFRDMINKMNESKFQNVNC